MNLSEEDQRDGDFTDLHAFLNELNSTPSSGLVTFFQKHVSETPSRLPGGSGPNQITATTRTRTTTCITTPTRQVDGTSWDLDLTFGRSGCSYNGS